MLYWWKNSCNNISWIYWQFHINNSILFLLLQFYPLPLSSFAYLQLCSYIYYLGGLLPYFVARIETDKWIQIILYSILYWEHFPFNNFLSDQSIIALYVLLFFVDCYSMHSYSLCDLLWKLYQNSAVIILASESYNATLRHRKIAIDIDHALLYDPYFISIIKKHCQDSVKLLIMHSQKVNLNRQLCFIFYSNDSGRFTGGSLASFSRVHWNVCSVILITK